MTDDAVHHFMHGAIAACCDDGGEAFFDRMLGYGLKYATAFGATHLGQVGRAAR